MINVLFFVWFGYSTITRVYFYLFTYFTVLFPQYAASSINRNIHGILSTSEEKDPFLVSCLLNVLLGGIDENITEFEDVDSSHVASVTLASNQHAIGMYALF